MDKRELCIRRLASQFLLKPGNRMAVVRAMNGFQAQFLSNAMHAMKLRSEAVDADTAADELVKSWTLRGRMHVFAEADLPLYLHDGCRYHSRDWMMPSFWNQRPDWALTPQRQAYFSDLIVDTLAQGPMTREALKASCRAAGMTEAEEASMFHPWGGGMRELCERGFLCGVVSEEKAFRLCPPFVPMAQEDARLEQLRRYFRSFGPASVKDAAYYFGMTQTAVKRLLPQLPLRCNPCRDETLYWLESEHEPTAGQALPDCMFLAGFDPLMLGYEKKQNVFLPQTYLRGVFSLSGIVMPPVLLHGAVTGRWKRSGKRLQITMFRPFTPEERRSAEQAAERIWGDAVKLVWLDA